MKPVMIALNQVRFDPVLQLRAELPADELVSLYAEAMERGEQFPAVDVFEEQTPKGVFYFLADGWHRVFAVQRNGPGEVLANVHPGGRAAAIKFALGANAKHGLPRNNEDKRKCVRVALKEFPALSDRGVAELCGVGHQLVGAVRRQVDDSSTSNPVAERKGKDGKSYPAGKPVVAKPAPVSTLPPMTALETYGERIMAREMGGIIHHPEKTDAELEAAARAESGIVAAVLPIAATPVAVVVREPVLKPGGALVAGAAFDSAKWKLRAREVLVAWMAEVPAKHRAAAAEYIRNQVSEIEQAG